VAGFTPMRTDVLSKGTGGIARYSRWLPLQPNLAAFITQEQRIPYDYHELLAMIAPRPVAVFAPKIDRYATLSEVKACVEDAKRVYELFTARDALRFEELDDYNHFSPETQQVVFERLRKMAGF